ncbi:MAG: riboflavin synthase [Verrucomicrobia bacterium]|nr:riboflavin synthase [Verrucomicrobiota bacterium]
MFTGLIEATGTFARLAQGLGGMARLALRVPDGFGPVGLGDSVAVNGVCLTAVQVDAHALEMDVLDETLGRTNLGELRPGERVNLERALTPSSPIGGHYVTGHVDDPGTVLRRTRSRQGRDWVFEIGVDAKYMPFIAPKGSIAVDGISLTVVEAREASFSVHIIPHTFTATTLGDRAEGSRVNIEIDIMARYIANSIQRMGNAAGGTALTKEFLAEHGFA